MVILPVAYLPSIKYFALLNKYELVYIEKHETYPRQTHRNRCVIYSANGKLNLSIPVSKPSGRHTKTKDVEICYDENWQTTHWRAIESAYNSSPFFLYYKDDLYTFFSGKKTKNLLEYNINLINLLIRLINMKCKILYTDSFIKTYNSNHDYRNIFSGKEKYDRFDFPDYPQVFSYKYGFIPNLSIIDLLFNMGAETKNYLSRIKV